MCWEMNKSSSTNIFVFSLKKPILANTNIKNDVFKLIKWSPDIFHWLPPNSKLTYFFFWLMKYLFIFKNQEYCAYKLVDKNNKTISSLICIPALYRWQFMNSNDIQIKNVFTNPEHRGKGYGLLLLKMIVEIMASDERTFWYMTNENNHASISLCKKAGFEYEGIFMRKRSNKLIYKGYILRK